MKIVIVGAGAMGSVFGARLAESGCETVLLDVRADVVEAIESSGITVRRDGTERRVPVRATMDAASVGRVDIALIFVKSFHTVAAAESIRPLVDDSTIVATLQNGLGNARILAEIFDPGQVVQGVTAESGTSLGPGIVDHPGSAPTYVGPVAGNSLTASESFAEVLRSAGFDAQATLDIETEIWKKLVIGASTLPAPALLGLACGPLMRHPQLHELVDDTAREVVAVARAKGLEVDAEERVAYIHDLLMEVEDAKGSMVQDIEAGRRTEIDVINGGIVLEADAHGVPVPINRTLVALVKGWESIRGLG
jgi:2-dehydropantoate 2-reductase